MINLRPGSQKPLGVSLDQSGVVADMIPIRQDKHTELQITIVYHILSFFGFGFERFLKLSQPRNGVVKDGKIKMSIKAIIVTLLMGFALACTSIPQAKEATTINQETSKSSPYAPMAPFEKFAGKLMRGEWAGDDGAIVVDISYGEMILDGRAFQGTHKIKGSSYGGRTIIFYDEGLKEYVYHYFTTGGFHTVGKIEITDAGYSAAEKVNGHPTIAAVSSTVTFDGDTQIVAVKYQTHEGDWSDAPVRTYVPYNGAKPFTE